MTYILEYKGKTPRIHSSAFIAATAVITGDVIIEENVSIWYGCVIRGDVAPIYIGKNSNVQDNTVIHGTRPNHILNKTSGEGAKTSIGENVTIGHNSLIHAGIIHSNAFIGMGSLIMDRSIVEEGAMLAAGSLLTPGKIVKSGSLWGGSPARFMRELTAEEIEYAVTSAANYHILAQEYKEIEKKLKQ